MASIKSESTVEKISCMVCGKGDFTQDNPPVRYKGYTDHMQCFRRDFIKKFIKKHDFLKGEDLEAVKNTLDIPKLNASWAALVDITPQSKEEGVVLDREAIVLWSDYKTKLETALGDLFMKRKGSIIGIFSKGKYLGYKTVMTIHIIEEN